VLVRNLAKILGCCEGRPRAHMLWQEQAEKEDAASYRE